MHYGMISFQDEILEISGGFLSTSSLAAKSCQQAIPGIHSYSNLGKMILSHEMYKDLGVLCLQTNAGRHKFQ